MRVLNLKKIQSNIIGNPELYEALTEELRQRKYQADWIPFLSQLQELTDIELAKCRENQSYESLAAYRELWDKIWVDLETATRDAEERAERRAAAQTPPVVEV